MHGESGPLSSLDKQAFLIWRGTTDAIKVLDKLSERCLGGITDDALMMFEK
jgi:hypothetical protein